MKTITENIITDQAVIPVMEHFYTLQGEGFHQGRAAYFIRLGGCDVGCVWCDVKDSWDMNAHPLLKIRDLVNSVKHTEAKMIVVTGGEPLMHDLNNLTSFFHKEGFQLNIETSGAYSLSGTWDWICVSPKKFKAPLREVLMKANELKIIVYNKSDFSWAEEHAAMTDKECKLFLQPEWSQAGKMTPLILEYIMKHPQWELSLQIHKYLNIP